MSDAWHGALQLKKSSRGEQQRQAAESSTKRLGHSFRMCGQGWRSVCQWEPTTRFFMVRGPWERFGVARHDQ